MGRYTKLPGNARAPATVRYRDPDDRVIELDRRDVQRQILAVLAAGPTAKWALRAGLHISEAVIYRELQALRAAGVVKAVGRRMTDRQWALASYQPAPTKGYVPIVPDAQTAIRTKKREPATDSWWTRRDLSRAEFQQIARSRAS